MVFESRILRIIGFHGILDSVVDLIRGISEMCPSINISSLRSSQRRKEQMDIFFNFMLQRPLSKTKAFSIIREIQ